VSIGTATNGAGTLTGNMLAIPSTGLTSTATAQQYHLSSTTSRLTMWAEADTAHGAGSNSLVFTVERPLDNVGAEVATGIRAAYFAKSGGFNGCRVDWVSAGTGLPGAIATDHAYCIFSSGIAEVGSQSTTFCVNSLGLNFQVQNPFLGVLLYYPGDVNAGEVMPPIELYGTDHTYISPNPNIGALNVVTVNPVPQILMLYE
jgi:hypothetical protein